MLKNVYAADELRALATRKAKSEEFKSVRNPLVDEEVANGWTAVKRNRTTSRLARPKAHDRLLEDRVWSLLYRMGFHFLSGQGGAQLALVSESESSPNNQIDVVAVDDEVAFAVECKSSAKPRKFSDFSADLSKHVALRDRFSRGVREQFAGSLKRTTRFLFWTSNIIVSENDQVRAEEASVSILDERDLEYYEQLVAEIGLAARFQFLADLLKERPVPGLEVTVPAIRSKMGSFTAYTFSVSPAYLLKIAFVSHRSRGKASDIDAYQRMLKKSRLKSIRNYISEGGIFPTNIVVNIAQTRWLQFDRGKQEGEGKNSTFGWLTLRPAYRVAWVIDGQHRLFGYANHPRAEKSLISVMAFVGLPASEQARLFVDINAQQRKVKQSLLQELYAELHWDAAEPDVRVQAILSKVIQALDAELNSPFRGRILKADDSRTDERCISLTSVFRALERGGFFIAKSKKGVVVEYGPLWALDNVQTMKRTATILMSYFSAIREASGDVWNRGAGEGGGLAMNDGVTVCVNVLKSVVHHLQASKRLRLIDLDADEVGEVLNPFGRLVGSYFASLTADQMQQFRSLRGVQGQTAGTRRVEDAIRRQEPDFDPPGLQEYLAREQAQTTTRAFEEIQRIEKILQRTVLSELKSEFGAGGQEWWFNGVPKGVRKKVDDRINDEAGKKGGREENFDLVDYREVILANWTLFEGSLGRGRGSKEARTKWLVDVNELRKPVMHASKGVTLPISEEQLTVLRDIRTWLASEREDLGGVADDSATSEGE